MTYYLDNRVPVVLLNAITLQTPGNVRREGQEMSSVRHSLGLDINDLLPTGVVLSVTTHQQVINESSIVAQPSSDRNCSNSVMDYTRQFGRLVPTAWA